VTFADESGGISHCHQPGKHHETINSVDITSQYPAVQLLMRIPVGDSRWTNDFKLTQYGYYLVSNIKWNFTKSLKPVAEYGSTGVLQWDNNNLQTAYIDSEMLKYLIENNYIIDYKITKGLVSNSHMKGETLFGQYVNNMFAKKKEQDSLKTQDKKALKALTIQRCFRYGRVAKLKDLYASGAARTHTYTERSSRRPGGE